MPTLASSAPHSDTSLWGAPVTKPDNQITVAHAHQTSHNHRQRIRMDFMKGSDLFYFWAVLKRLSSRNPAAEDYMNSLIPMAAI
jgi:hypothetical protein